jgi:hypothetical protein
MKVCSKCGTAVADEIFTCTSCGADLTSDESILAYTDDINPIYCILAVLCPLFGFIYWPLKRKKTPARAFATGLSSLISFGVNLAAIIISLVL